MSPLKTPETPVKTLGTTAKMVVLAVLILAFLVPLILVRGVIFERRQRLAQVEGDLAASWGGAQTLVGPVLSVPYTTHYLFDDGRQALSEGEFRALPEELKVTGRLEPEIRNRGLFEVVVYRLRLTLTGHFLRPEAPSSGANEQVIVEWAESEVAVGIPDLRGIDGAAAFEWNGQTLAMKPGPGTATWLEAGIHGRVPGLGEEESGDQIPFFLELTLNGSGRFAVVPAARRTRVEVSSPWPHPSFSGSYLPRSHEITEQGFTADWTVAELGRTFPAEWTRELENPDRLRQLLWSTAFGVELVQPVDVYRKTERAAKYGILFLVLTFTTFFLFEIFHPWQLHPLQYALVGCALCLFYLLLLSTAEHVPFAVAYTVATAATVALIGGYAAAILHGRLRALGLAGMLVLTYGYLYVLLQLEDYALLLGTLGLFLILATVMALTRKINWYSTKTAAPGPAFSAKDLA